MTEVEKIARGLTESQTASLLALDERWALAPYCGWHRRTGHVCHNLVAKGLAERVYGRCSDKNTAMFRLNECGLAVRQYLREQSQ